MRTSKIAVRVGYLDRPTQDGRVIRRIAAEGPVPVYNALAAGRDLAGVAVLREPSSSRVTELLAELEVAPFVAALILRYERFVHLELVGGSVERADGLTYLTDPRLGCLYVSEQPWAWPQPWAGELEAVPA